MAEQISQRELRNDSGRIMRALDEGYTFIVSRNGHPVGELRPLRRQRFITAQAAVEMYRHAPQLDWDSVRADIDEYVDQDIEPRG
ncbi:prevent-host-death protein [Promicromonospora sp. NPDC023987]|uniref:type II toxin-antitoxin system Phd/YefM family antitoxin n=1 Tax=Promicromonospora sp. NPDC023987 TaxID=3155360 RepID=UPI0033D412A0